MSRVLGILILPLVLPACGGSSSETPWPAEPVASAFEPVGEGPAPAANGSAEAEPEAPPPR